MKSGEMGRGALRCITGRKGTPLLCCSSLKAIVTHLHLVQISDCRHTEASSSTIRNRDTTMISKYKLVRSLHWPVIVMEANVRQCQPALICIKAIDTLWEGASLPRVYWIKNHKKRPCCRLKSLCSHAL